MKNLEKVFRPQLIQDIEEAQEDDFWENDPERYEHEVIEFYERLENIMKDSICEICGSDEVSVISIISLSAT